MNVVQVINVPQPVKLTIDDFVLLEEAGAFDGYAKTELIEGVVFAMNSQFRAHAYAKMELAFRLHDRLKNLGSPLYPMAEGTVAMPPHSAPEPDISLTSEPRGEGYIPLASVALAVEVAVSTVKFDLGKKAMLYARHGIPEYWVLDVADRAIHQLWSPSEKGYAERRLVKLGEPVESITVEGLAVDTAGLV